MIIQHTNVIVRHRQDSARSKNSYQAKEKENVEMKYREYPAHKWAFDTKNFHYFGLDTTLVLNNISRSMKENIYSYSLRKENGNGVTVLDDGKSACRFDKTHASF